MTPWQKIMRARERIMFAAFAGWMIGIATMMLILSTIPERWIWPSAGVSVLAIASGFWTVAQVPKDRK